MAKIIPIIIVTYNKVEQFTIPCIESIVSNTDHPYKIVVVDNNSEDNTPDILRNKFSFIDVISSGQNLGWAGGSLLGIEHIDKNYDYNCFCLLNSDTLVSSNWLAKLETIINKHERAATIVPTETIVTSNYVKQLYNNYVSQNKLLMGLIAHSPLKHFMGKGICLPNEIGPQLPESFCNTGIIRDNVTRLNLLLENKYKDTVSSFSYINTGYCVLLKNFIKDDYITYLNNFDTLFPYKSIAYWNEISERKKIEHLVSKGTYVYHYRGGSGGY
jgi:glycosyltransferase involved in cell wall biosynthesis